MTPRPKIVSSVSPQFPDKASFSHNSDYFPGQKSDPKLSKNQWVLQTWPHLQGLIVSSRHWESCYLGCAAWYTRTTQARTISWWLIIRVEGVCDACHYRIATTYLRWHRRKKEVTPGDVHVNLLEEEKWENSSWLLVTKVWRNNLPCTSHHQVMRMQHQILINATWEIGKLLWLLC